MRTIGPVLRSWQSRLQRCYPVCLLVFLLLAMAPPAFPVEEKDRTILLGEHLSLGLKTEYLFKSHTSYEFGNPFPPYHAPLSRLEFPLDSWWGGAELRVVFPRFSIGAEALTNLSREAAGNMKDSDWDDDAQPHVKTIYSESRCRMQPSYMVKTDMDLRISDWLGLPAWLDLRPVAGFRWQNFNLVTHDGFQHYLMEEWPPYPLPGDGIAFEQTYWHYFLGMRAGIDFGKRLMLKSLATLLQFDWAYVEGHNEDQHLLRAGSRYTYENTYGQAWHGSIGLKAGVAERLYLDLAADFLAVSTSGSHRLVNAPFDMDMTFSHGVRVWSAQNSLSLKLQYVF